MKTLASVALLALAAGLGTSAAAQDAASAGAVSATAATYPMTPEGARDFVAAVEKDLFDFSVESARVQWINATYIIDDTDALAARYGAIGTEKSVEYALE